MPASDFADLFAKPLSKIVFPKSAEVHTFIYHSNNENKARKEFLAQHKSKVIHTNKNKKQKTKITKFNTSKPLNKQVLKQVDNSVIETNDPDLKLPERKVSKQHKWPTIKPLTKTWYDKNDKNIISPVSPSVPGVDLLGALLNSNLNSVSIGHNPETKSQCQPKNDQSSFKTNEVFKKPIKKPLSSPINNKSIKEIAEKYKKKTSEKADNIGKRPSDAFNKTHINKETRETSDSFSINNNDKPLNTDNSISANSVKITDASSIKTKTEKTSPTLTSVKRSIKVKDLIGPTKELIINIDIKSREISKNQYLNSSPVSINNTNEEPLQKIKAPKFLKESNNLIHRESDNEFVKLRINEKKSNSKIFNLSEEKNQFVDFIPSNDKNKCLSLDEILLNISDEIYIERSEQKANGQLKKAIDHRSDTKSFFEIENFVKAPAENNLETSPKNIDEELLNQGKIIENQLESSENMINSQQRQVLKQNSKKNEKEIEKGNSNHKVFFKVENLVRATNENSRKSSPIKPPKDSPRKQSVDVFDLCFASKKESHDELNLEKVVEHLTKPKTADTPSQVGNTSQFSDKEDSDELVIDAAEDDVGNNEHSQTLRKIPRNLYYFRELNSDSDEDKVKESKSDSGCDQGLGNNRGEGDLEEGEIENESDINDERNLKSLEAINRISEENLFDKSKKVNLMKNNLRKSEHHEKDKLKIHEPEKDPDNGIETKKNNSKLIGKSKRKRKSRDNSMNNKNSKKKEFHSSNRMISYSDGTNANKDRIYTRKLRSSSASSINGKSDNIISYNTRRRSDLDHSTSIINDGDQKQRTRHNQRSYVNVKPDHEQTQMEDGNKLLNLLNNNAPVDISVINAEMRKRQAAFNFDEINNAKKFKRKSPSRQKATQEYFHKKRIEMERQRERAAVDKTRPCEYLVKHGKCDFGDSCRFSHDVEVEKRLELCRYYISNQCLKGDKCLFYHEQWPCKFHHMYGRCTNDSCKYSHEEMSEELRKAFEARMVLEESWKNEQTIEKATQDMPMNQDISNPSRKSQELSIYQSTEPAVEQPSKEQSNETHIKDEGSTGTKKVEDFQFPSLYYEL